MHHVSLLTPTYNRREYLKTAIIVVQNFQYPRELLEWIIIDDGRENNSDLFEAIPYARYIYLTEKITLDKKRNMLNEMAQGSVLINLDDDDYYPPTRITHAVERLLPPGISPLEPRIAGAFRSHIYFLKQKEIWFFLQPSCGAASLAYTKKYAENRKYQSTYIPGVQGIDRQRADNSGEELAFQQGSSVLELEPEHTILVMNHNSNTIDKRFYIDIHETGKLRGLKCHLTGYVLKNFIKDPDLRARYER